MEDNEQANERAQDARSDLASGECATINDKGEVFFCRKHLGTIGQTFPDDRSARRAIRAAMDKAQFWPNLYTINDHGNVSCVSLRTGKAYKGMEWVSL